MFYLFFLPARYVQPGHSPPPTAPPSTPSLSRQQFTNVGPPLQVSGALNRSPVRVGDATPLRPHTFCLLRGDPGNPIKQIELTAPHLLDLGNRDCIHQQNSASGAPPPPVHRTKEKAGVATHFERSAWAWLCHGAAHPLHCVPQQAEYGGHVEWEVAPLEETRR